MHLGQTDAGRVLARFADGTPALAAPTEGRVLVFASETTSGTIASGDEVVRYPVQPDVSDGVAVGVGGFRHRDAVLNVDPRESDLSRVTRRFARVAPTPREAPSAAQRTTDPLAKRRDIGGTCCCMARARGRDLARSNHA